MVLTLIHHPQTTTCYCLMVKLFTLRSLRRRVPILGIDRAASPVKINFTNPKKDGNLSASLRCSALSINQIHINALDFVHHDSSLALQAQFAVLHETFNHMSGAEVILLAGLFASVSQLVDYTDKTGSYLFDVARKVRSAPDALRKLYDEACTIRSWTKKLESSPTSIATEFQWFVRACACESQELIEIIEHWHLDKNAREVPARDRLVLGFKWKWRERRIREHLENLSRHKTSLVLCTATSGLAIQAISTPEIVSCLWVIGHNPSKCRAKVPHST